VGLIIRRRLAARGIPPGGSENSGGYEAVAPGGVA